MSFLKQKEQEFNFFSKNKEKKKKKISTLQMLLFGFIALQVGFFSADVSHLQKMANESSKETEQLLSSYIKTKEAMKEGDQTKIIANYAQITNSSYLSKLLTGSLLQYAMFSKDNISDKNNKDIDKQYSIQVQPETINTLKNIYEESLKFKTESKFIQNCSILDLSCHLINHYIKKSIAPVLKKQDDTILKVQYNINHPEEYKRWSEQLSESQKKDINYNQKHPEIYLSPGDKYIQNLNKFKNE